MCLQLEQLSDESTGMEAILPIQNQISGNKNDQRTLESTTIWWKQTRGKIKNMIPETNLWFKICGEQNIWRLDVSMNNPSLASLVQIMQASSSTNCNLMPYFPFNCWRIHICSRAPFKWLTNSKLRGETLKKMIEMKHQIQVLYHGKVKQQSL